MGSRNSHKFIANRVSDIQSQCVDGLTLLQRKKGQIQYKIYSYLPNCQREYSFFKFKQANHACLSSQKNIYCIPKDDISSDEISNFMILCELYNVHSYQMQRLLMVLHIKIDNKLKIIFNFIFYLILYIKLYVINYIIWHYKSTHGKQRIKNGSQKFIWKSFLNGNLDR